MRSYPIHSRPSSRTSKSRSTWWQRISKVGTRPFSTRANYRPAIAGSIAIPSVFKPVRYANHLLVDGGVVNPLPVDQASGQDILVAIDVNGDPSDALSRGEFRALDIWFGSAQIMMHSLTAHMMAAYPPDVYVRPHLSAIGAMEFWRVKEIIEHADKEKDNFKRHLSHKVELHLKRAAGTIRAGD